MSDNNLRLSPSEARARLDAGRAIALDVVQPNAWADLDRVVAGALRMPPDDVERRYGELPSERGSDAKSPSHGRGSHCRAGSRPVTADRG